MASVKVMKVIVDFSVMCFLEEENINNWFVIPLFSGKTRYKITTNKPKINK